MLIILLAFDIDELLINSASSQSHPDWNGGREIWIKLLRDLTKFAAELSKVCGIEIKIVFCIITSRKKLSPVIEEIILTFRDYLFVHYPDEKKPTPLITATHYYIHHADKIFKVPLDGKNPEEMKQDPGIVPVYLTCREIEGAMTEIALKTKLAIKYDFDVMENPIYNENDLTKQSKLTAYYKHLHYSHKVDGNELIKVHIYKSLCLEKLRKQFQIKNPTQIGLADNNKKNLANAAKLGFFIIDSSELAEKSITVNTSEARVKRADIAKKLVNKIYGVMIQKIYDRVKPQMPMPALKFFPSMTAPPPARDDASQPKKLILENKGNTVLLRLPAIISTVYLHNIDNPGTKHRSMKDRPGTATLQRKENTNSFQIDFFDREHKPNARPAIVFQIHYPRLDNLCFFRFRNTNYFACRYFQPQDADASYKSGICVFDMKGTLLAEYTCKLTWFHVAAQEGNVQFIFPKDGKIVMMDFETNFQKQMAQPQEIQLSSPRQ